MPVREMEIAKDSNPWLTTFVFNDYSGVPQGLSRTRTAGARSFANERSVKMQLSFCADNNVIFQPLFSFIPPAFTMLCMVTVFIAFRKSLALYPS